jgi:hypothetical protein
MRVIGGKDDIGVADLLDDVSQLFLFALATDPAAPRTSTTLSAAWG